jgi:hypothetical protein
MDLSKILVRLAALVGNWLARMVVSCNTCHTDSSRWLSIGR